jgi:prolyl-tRNA synthetase
VPLRIDVGPREVVEKTEGLARRDRPGRAGKQTVAQDRVAQTVQELLYEIHHSLVARATGFMSEHTRDVTSYDKFKEAIETGFARVWWDGTNEDELRVKEETRATLRCFPLEQPDGTGRCFYTGRTATRVAIFGRAY